MAVRLPTFIRRYQARVGGYFWLPCPQCGEMFGGHECGSVHVQMRGSGRILCRWCAPRRKLYRVTQYCTGIGPDSPCTHDGAVNAWLGFSPFGWAGEVGDEWLVCPGCIADITAMVERVSP